MASARVKQGLGRHLEGWQAGLVAIAIAGLGLLFGVPRAVVPRDMPVPVPDATELRKIREVEQTRAQKLVRATEAERVARFDQRAVGDLIRQFGEADLAHDQARLATLRTEIAASVRRLRATEEGTEQLLELRSYQLGVFLTDLHAWEKTGKESDDMRAYAGDFVALLTKSGWLRLPRRIIPDDTVRAALFKRRFMDVTGLREPRFALTLDEHRALYAFLLSHPPPGGDPSGGAEGSSAEARERGKWGWLFRKSEEIGAVDPTYPADLARGIALLHLGETRGSVAALQKHLAEHPDGPYTLRARNHLAAALSLVGP